MSWCPGAGLSENRQTREDKGGCWFRPGPAPQMLMILWLCPSHGSQALSSQWKPWDPLSIRYYCESLDEGFGPLEPNRGLLCDPWKANLNMHRPLREAKCICTVIIAVEEGMNDTNQANFLLKGKIVNTVGFVGHSVSAATAQPCGYSIKAARDDP